MFYILAIMFVYNTYLDKLCINNLNISKHVQMTATPQIVYYKNLMQHVKYTLWSQVDGF